MAVYLFMVVSCKLLLCTVCEIKRMNYGGGIVIAHKNNFQARRGSE